MWYNHAKDAGGSGRVGDKNYDILCGIFRCSVRDKSATKQQAWQNLKRASLNVSLGTAAERSRRGFTIWRKLDNQHISRCRSQ